MGREQREHLSWETFGSAARELAQLVVNDGFTPTSVLAVTRGGLAVGGAISYALGVKNCCVINVEYYTGVDERLEVPVILPPALLLDDLRGARVLVVDDVADTGGTLQLVSRPSGPTCAELRSRGALREAAQRGAVQLRVAANRALDRVPLVETPPGHPGGSGGPRWVTDAPRRWSRSAQPAIARSRGRADRVPAVRLSPT